METEHFIRGSVASEQHAGGGLGRALGQSCHCFAHKLNVGLLLLLLLIGFSCLDHPCWLTLPIPCPTLWFAGNSGAFARWAHGGQPCMR